MARALGYRPDPPSSTDYGFGALGLASMPPGSATLKHLVVDVLDQGGLSSCVANAGMQAIRMSQVRQRAARAITPLQVAQLRMSPPPLGSRLFGYYLSRATHHEMAVDGGTFLRSFFAMANKFGFPPEALWSYDDSNKPDAPFSLMPSTRAFQAAFDQRSPTIYRRVDGLLDVRRALAGGFAVCFGVDVDAAFVAGDFDPAVPLEVPSRNIVGGHAMVLVGYDEDHFEVLNSWGTGFGAGGYFLAASSFIEAARDVWAVESAPIFSRAA
jgi:C1A family cysteine protease